MKSITQILSEMEEGASGAAEQLLPLVYHELRKLAARRLARERPGQTLQPTALVHEAYIRLVESTDGQSWNGRGHFFAAAAEAMRRILVEHARRRGRVKRGGRMQRERLSAVDLPAVSEKSDEVLMIDEALAELEERNPSAARLVKLRYFAGFTNDEAAELLGVSPRKASQTWTYARTWLLAQIEKCG